MRRRLLGTLAWILLLPVAGTGRLVWFGIRTLGSLSLKTQLTLVGLALALSMPNPVTENLSLDAVRPLGHVIVLVGVPALGAVVLAQGARSPWVRRVRRGLRRHGF
jgi:hypothetical protein